MKMAIIQYELSRIKGEIKKENYMRKNISSFGNINENSKSRQQLRSELDEISKEIYKIKDLLNENLDNKIKLELRKKLKELQWQALFYIEKIDNDTNNEDT